LNNIEKKYLFLPKIRNVWPSTTKNHNRIRFRKQDRVERRVMHTITFIIGNNGILYSKLDTDKPRLE
jgi:hypothetical protein